MPYAPAPWAPGPRSSRNWPCPPPWPCPGGLELRRTEPEADPDGVTVMASPEAKPMADERSCSASLGSRRGLIDGEGLAREVAAGCGVGVVGAVEGRLPVVGAGGCRGEGVGGGECAVAGDGRGALAGSAASAGAVAQGRVDGVGDRVAGERRARQPGQRCGVGIPAPPTAPTGRQSAVVSRRRRP